MKIRGLLIIFLSTFVGLHPAAAEKQDSVGGEADAFPPLADLSEALPQPDQDQEQAVDLDAVLVAQAAAAEQGVPLALYLSGQKHQLVAFNGECAAYAPVKSAREELSAGARLRALRQNYWHQRPAIAGHYEGAMAVGGGALPLCSGSRRAARTTHGVSRHNPYAHAMADRRQNFTLQRQNGVSPYDEEEEIDPTAALQAQLAAIRLPEEAVPDAAKEAPRDGLAEMDDLYN